MSCTVQPTRVALMPVGPRGSSLIPVAAPADRAFRVFTEHRSSRKGSAPRSRTRLLARRVVPLLPGHGSEATCRLGRIVGEASATRNRTHVRIRSGR